MISVRVLGYRGAMTIIGVMFAVGADGCSCGHDADRLTSDPLSSSSSSIASGPSTPGQSKVAARIDRARAIAIAVDHAKKRGNPVHDKDIRAELIGGTWRVTISDRPPVPGGFFTVIVSAAGKVATFGPGSSGTSRSRRTRIAIRARGASSSRCTSVDPRKPVGHDRNRPV